MRIGDWGCKLGKKREEYIFRNDVEEEFRSRPFGTDVLFRFEGVLRFGG